MVGQPLGEIGQRGVNHQAHPSDAPVMVADEAEVVDHGPEAVPTGKSWRLDDEAGQTAGRADLRIDRPGQDYKITCRECGLGPYVQDGRAASSLYSIIVSSAPNRQAP